jgi:hypothetical protein
MGLHHPISSLVDRCLKRFVEKLLDLAQRLLE